jgi:hypothetical protein
MRPAAPHVRRVVAGKEKKNMQQAREEMVNVRKAIRAAPGQCSKAKNLD